MYIIILSQMLVKLIKMSKQEPDFSPQVAVELRAYKMEFQDSHHQFAFFSALTASWQGK